MKRQSVNDECKEKIGREVKRNQKINRKNPKKKKKQRRQKESRKIRQLTRYKIGHIYLKNKGTKI